MADAEARLSALRTGPWRKKTAAKEFATWMYASFSTLPFVRGSDAIARWQTAGWFAGLYGRRFTAWDKTDWMSFMMTQSQFTDWYKDALKNALP